MKKKLIAMMLLAGASAFAAPRISFGIGIGAPVYAPAPVYDARPPAPGPGYVWVDGYSEANGAFVPGYWALPPYSGAFWIAPTFVGGVFHAGYWGRPGFDRDGFVNRGFDDHANFDNRARFDDHNAFHASAAPARQFGGRNEGRGNSGFRR